MLRSSWKPMVWITAGGLLALAFGVPPAVHAEAAAAGATDAEPGDRPVAAQLSREQLAVSDDGLWRELPELADQAPVPLVQPSARAWPRAFRVYELADSLMDSKLAAAPMELTPGVERGAIVSLPLPDGSFTRVRVEESPILSSALQQRRPEIRTYRFQGVGEPTLRGRLGVTLYGFHAWIIGVEGTAVIEEYPERPGLHIVYRLEDLPPTPFRCLTPDTPVETAALHAISPAFLSGDTLRTYRLAINATGEFTLSQGGVANAESRIAMIVNQATAIYENEVAISFVLVRNNAYPVPDTDPFDDTDGTGVRTDNQNQLDGGIGSGAYDIGHLITTSNRGLAAVAVVCQDGSKALARSGGEGGRFVIVLSHEMGHQFSARHTWNGDCFPSQPGQYSPSSAYEAGSGSTIMSYAGVCSSGDIQFLADQYFHTHSFDQIVAYREGGGACGTQTTTGNTVPVADAGPDRTVPQSTPFTLTAGASDADGETLTFSWEQFDLGPQAPAPMPSFTAGPMFRSRPATVEPSRTFPRFSDLLSGTPTPWEVLAGVDRDLTFRAIARDNRADGGGVDFDTMIVHVQGDPFFVSSPASGDAAECGWDITVEWQVGGGSIASDVGVSLSIDDGPFVTQLASTPNDGSQTVPIPAGVVTDPFGAGGRFLLEPIGEVFFSLSDEFDIHDTLDPQVTAPADVQAECTRHAGTPVDIGTAGATDFCDPSVPVGNDAPALFPLGDTVVTWSATDDAANTGTDTQTVTIVDTTAPQIEVSVSPDLLWPPNHKLVTIQATVVVSDICDPDPQVRLVSIVSDEPDDGEGDGDTEGDIQGADFGTDDREFQLRAERSGQGDGRVYTITYEVEDGSGNVSTDTAVVTVPHSL